TSGPAPWPRLLNRFPVQRQIETFLLRIVRHAQADRHVYHGEYDQAGDGVVDDDDGHPGALIEELTDVALQHTGSPTILLDGKNSGEKRTDNAANRMHAETIERVVIAEQ